MRLTRNRVMAKPFSLNVYRQIDIDRVVAETAEYITTHTQRVCLDIVQVKE